MSILSTVLFGNFKPPAVAKVKKIVQPKIPRNMEGVERENERRRLEQEALYRSVTGPTFNRNDLVRALGILPTSANRICSMMVKRGNAERIPGTTKDDGNTLWQYRWL